MRQGLEQRLRGLDPEFFGVSGPVECMDGWYGILEGLASKTAVLNSVAARRGMAVVANRIRERFGSLRIRWEMRPLSAERGGALAGPADASSSGGLEMDSLSSIVEDAVERARLLSETVCEWCGRSGGFDRDLSEPGPARHLCRDCVRKYSSDVAREPILRYDGDYGFLRFYSDDPVTVDGRRYFTFPGLYFSMLCPEREPLFRGLRNPFDAVEIARELGIAEDSGRAVAVMEKALRVRFGRDGHFRNSRRDLLKWTAGLELAGMNPFHENFWGGCWCGMCRSKEHLNHYGRILMHLREEFIREDAKAGGFDGH